MDSWSPNIVVGKSFDAASRDGRYLWDAVVERVAAHTMTPNSREEAVRFGSPRLITPRLGQGAFRVAVTDSYTRRCAVTGERTLPVLDAAHIKPYSEGGCHDVNNGLLLRTDIHKLFDCGYVTIDPTGNFEVSRRLREDFQNGRHYYELQGKALWLPDRPEHRPTPEALEWHRTERFLAQADAPEAASPQRSVERRLLYASNPV